jgi:hypothetical protein
VLKALFDRFLAFFQSLGADMGAKGLSATMERGIRQEILCNKGEVELWA